MALTSLPLFHRVDGQRVVVVGDGDMAQVKRRLVERAGAVCCRESEAHHARLAFVALEDRRAAESTAMRLKSRGLLVNVADRPELCDFTLPSVLERGPVVIAVGTGGASAALAKQLRLRLETLLPASLGMLAEALHGARAALRERWPEAAVRRRALDAALTEGGVLDPLSGGAHARLDDWLHGSNEVTLAETAEITLASDDPDDLTLRQARLLGTADAVVHDADVAEAILARARADAVRNPAAPVAGLTVVIRR